MRVKLERGLDLRIGGAPEQAIRAGLAVREVAVLPGDHAGLRARASVAQADRVRRGQPVAADRRRPEFVLTAPGPGVVTEVRLGEKRMLAAVVIALDGDGDRNAEDEQAFPSHAPASLATLDRAAVASLLLQTGQWSAFRTRPAHRLPDPTVEPAAIFVTAMDTNPLAADPRVALAGREDDLAAGLTILTRLTRGPVFLCHAPGPAISVPHERVVAACFEGPHPSGLPGTHVHHLHPVTPGVLVWHVGCQDVLAIGQSFTTGRLDTRRVVSIAGPAAPDPHLARAPLGSSIRDLIGGASFGDGARCISGSILSGRNADALPWLSRHDVQLSVIAEASHAERPLRAFSAVRRWFASTPSRAWSTALQGSVTGLVPTELFESVFPFDIEPTPLLRALLAGNADAAIEMGCMDLDEEDLALLSFVCHAKHDHGARLRDMLTRIASETAHA